MKNIISSNPKRRVPASVCVWYVTSHFIKRRVCEGLSGGPRGGLVLITDGSCCSKSGCTTQLPERIRADGERVGRKETNNRGREKVEGNTARKRQGLPVALVQYENTQSERISSWAH